MSGPEKVGGPEKIEAGEPTAAGQGSDSPARSEECKRLLKVIEDADEKEAKIVPAGGEKDIGALGPAAKAFDASAKAIGAVKLTVPELIQFQKDLVVVRKDLASATRTAQTSIKGGNASKASAAVEDLKRGQATNTQRMSELKAFCKGS